MESGKGHGSTPGGGGMKALKGRSQAVKKEKISSRLHVYGRVLSFRRSRRHTRENTVLVRIDGLKDKKDCDFYLGKRVVYWYPVKKKDGKLTKRKILGRITAPHGNSGVTRARFTKNLPPSSFGKTVQIKLYPSRI